MHHAQTVPLASHSSLQHRLQLGAPALAPVGKQPPQYATPLMPMHEPVQHGTTGLRQLDPGDVLSGTQASHVPSRVHRLAPAGRQ